MSKGGELLGWLVGCIAVLGLLGLPTFVLWSGHAEIQPNVQTPAPRPEPAISATQVPSPLAPTATPKKNPPKAPRPPRREMCDCYDEDDNFLYSGRCDVVRRTCN
jgi:hypothetical protein